MAAFKDTRANGCEPNPFFLELFRDLSDSGERTWHTAMAHAGEGIPPLRFPVYETLYLINVHAQKLVDLMEELSSRFGILHGMSGASHEEILGISIKEGDEQNDGASEESTEP
jgi:hypothetical protein